MSSLIVISIAHDREGGDPGALAPDGTTTEAGLSEVLSRLVVAGLGSHGVLLGGSLSEAIKSVNKLTNVAGAVEFHFDVGRGVRSTVFVSPKARSATKSLASHLKDVIEFTCPWYATICPARPPFTARKRLAWCEDVRAPSVVFEVGFLDNPTHLAWLKTPRNMERLARSLVAELETFLQERAGGWLDPGEAARATMKP